MRLNNFTKFKNSIIKMVSAENYQNLVGKTLIKSGQESSVQKSDNHVSFFVYFNLHLIIIIYV
jgi:hypothetical protein